MKFHRPPDNCNQFICNPFGADLPSSQVKTNAMLKLLHTPNTVLRKQPTGWHEKGALLSTCQAPCYVFTWKEKTFAACAH